MTDYYPLLKRAVEGLDKSTGEARRSLYERARTALVDQLRGMKPPLSESEITRERLALEEAVRKVEAEAARRLREPAPSPPENARASRPESQQRPPAPVREAPPLNNGAAASRPDQRPSAAPPQSTEAQRGRAAADRPSAAPEGVKGLRDVVAEAQTLGGATARAATSAREAYAAVPSATPERDRLEPRMEPEGLREPAPRRAPPRPGSPAYPAADAEMETGERPAAPPPERPAEPRRRAAAPMPRRGSGYDRDEPGNPARKGLIAAISALVVLGLIAGAAYWQRDRISALFGVVRGLAPQAQRDANQSRPKIADRVGQDAQPEAARPGQPQTAPGSRPGQQVPAVAQRVVLYEEDPTTPEGNRYVGSALWRTETVSPGPGLSPELAVRVDVEVPDRRLAMTMSIRRNTDKALPATHTVEIMFNLPADFAFGGVANVPGLLMKESEQQRGAPLSGLAVKVTNNFFLIGLSAVDADLQRNLTLLKERAWFDVPIVYNNGRRAILAIEKGNPGERVFNDAFATWKQ
jgi:hypothetical protein